MIVEGPLQSAVVVYWLAAPRQQSLSAPKRTRKGEALSDNHFHYFTIRGAISAPPKTADDSSDLDTAARLLGVRTPSRHWQPYRHGEPTRDKKIT